MKRIIATILTVAALFAATLTVTSCGEREKFDFSGVSSISDLKGAIIAAQTGTFHLDALNGEGKEKGMIAKEYKDFPALLTALNSGAIDGYIAEEPTAFAVVAQNSELAYLALKNNDTGFTATDEDTGIAVAFAKGSALVAQANAALAEVTADVKSQLMQKAVEMSLDTDKSVAGYDVLAIGEVAADAPVLKIAMECGYEPFNWTQETDVNGAVKISNGEGYANGYDVQIAKYIAYKLGMKLEVYAAEWDSLIPGVQSRSYDGIIAGMSPTAERKKEVDFTDCYYNSNLVIIYKK